MEKGFLEISEHGKLPMVPKETDRAKELPMQEVRDTAGSAGTFKVVSVLCTDPPILQPVSAAAVAVPVTVA
jgi:hypothetical protein